MRPAAGEGARPVHRARVLRTMLAGSVATLLAATAVAQQVVLRPTFRRGLLATHTSTPRIQVVDVDGEGGLDVLSCGCNAFLMSYRGGGEYVDTWSSEALRWGAKASFARAPDGRGAIYIAARDESSGDTRLPEELLVYSPGQLVAAARLHVADDLNDLAVADVDADGQLEVVLVGDRATTVLDASSLQLEWTGQGYGGLQVAVGDLDGDGTPEIVVNGELLAHVLDAAAREEEYAWNGGFGESISLADVDHDGRSDIAFLDEELGVGVLDGSSLDVVWTRPADTGFASLATGDVDGDGAPDVVAAERDGGPIRVYAGGTGATLCELDNPEEEAYAVAAGDLDGDGAAEVVWSSPQHLVADAATGVVEWESPNAGVGVACPGDVDGDGRAELATAGHSYGQSDLQLLDLGAGTVRWTAAAPETTTALAIGQIDLDADLEVVALTDHYENGTRLHVLDAVTGQLEWESVNLEIYTALGESHSRPGGSITTTKQPLAYWARPLEAEDIDGDGRDELVVRVGFHLLVLDDSGAAPLWLSSSHDLLAWDFSIGNVDGDAALEIALLENGHVHLVDSRTWRVQTSVEVGESLLVHLAGDLVVVGGERSVNDPTEVRAYSTGGDLRWARSFTEEDTLYLATARWNGRDCLAVATGTTYLSYHSRLTILDLDGGNELATEVRPRTLPGGLFGHDVDGDGEDELVRPFSCMVEVDEIEQVPAAVLAVGSATTDPGEVVEMGLELAAGGTQVSTLIFDLRLDEPLAFAGARAGAAALAAGKTVLAGPIPAGARISVVGGEGSLLGDGAVAEVELEVAADADAGRYEVEARVASSTDPDGAHVPLSTTAGEVEVAEGPPPPPSCWSPAWFVAAAAHLPGEAGSQWRTDLSIFNPSAYSVPLALWFYPRGADSSAASCVRVDDVPSGASVLFEDVVLQIFGLEGAGGIGIGSPPFPPPSLSRLMVNSRTYNQTDHGTFGQSIPGVLYSSGGIPRDRASFLAQLHENPDYRTNLGFFSWNGATVDVRLHAADGSLLAERSVVLRAYESTQLNRVFGAGANVTNGFAEITVTSGSGVLAYASVVDNRTGDPTYVEPQ